MRSARVLAKESKATMVTSKRVPSKFPGIDIRGLMKLIIAGSRHLTDIDSAGINTLIEYCEIENVTEIVSGAAKGIDSVGEQYAKDYNIKLTTFPAQWDRFGKAAGYIRNKEMAEYADELLLIWDGKSRGSSNMKEVMQKLDKPVNDITV